MRDNETDQSTAEVARIQNRLADKGAIQYALGFPENYHRINKVLVSDKPTAIIFCTNLHY